MIRRILAALNAGQIVTTNLDVMSAGASAEVFRLFEKANVLLPAVVGAAKAAKLSRALVLPWSNRRDGHGRLVLRFEQPFFADEGAAALSQRLRDLLENWIVESPEQWIYWDRFEKRLCSDEAL
jgi:lauroyl/myristoyl acyltransferase